MKKTFFFGLVALLLTSGKLFAQPTAGIYISCINVTTGAGTGDHPDEVQIISQEEGASLPAGGGLISFADFVIVKNFDRSSLRLKNLFLRALLLPNNLEIRYYNGIAAQPVYVILLQTTIITSIVNSNQNCTGNCPDISETISFAPIIITWRNQAVTPNQVLTYNRNTGVVTSSGL